MSTEPLDLGQFEGHQATELTFDSLLAIASLMAAELRSRRAKDAAVRELVEAADVLVQAADSVAWTANIGVMDGQIQRAKIAVENMRKASATEEQPK